MEEKSTTKKEYNHGKPSVFVGGLKDEADEGKSFNFPSKNF